MTENVENLFLEHLKRFQTTLERVERKIDEHTQRLAGVESAIASVKRDTADIYSELAAQNVRHDSTNARIERIELRLELA